MYYVYLLKCSDGTLYCGIAKDLEKRVKEHNGILSGGAKYTSGRRPVKLVYYETCQSLSEALTREAKIKKLNRANKITLANERDLRLSPRELNGE